MTEQDIIIRDEESRWDPRFLAYARFHGNSPEQQMRLDRARYPNCALEGFVSWQESQLRIFHCLQGRNPQAAELTAEEQGQFEASLGRRFHPAARQPQEPGQHLLAA